MTSFADLSLSPPLLDALRHLGYERPTPIQEQAIPALLEGRDVIGQAQTGTGKTAAFGLPLLEYVDPEDPQVQALVLTPTRELCIQVTQAVRAYGERRGVDVVAVFGGAPIRDQVSRLGQGAQVVVGTVGRVMDLMRRHALMLDSARYVVLDEADEMLDLGFLEDVETILSRCPSGRQTALFSATIPPEIEKLAGTRMYDPVTVRVRAATLTIDTVDHYYVEVSDREKADALARVLRTERPEQAIVFVRTKIGTDRLARALGDRGVRVRALHGDMSQGARDGVMLAFKGGREPLLVATDVAARGLDITGVTHVVNYDIPGSPDVYVHRIGRTGRVGRSGRAITLVTPRQRRELEAIERHAGVEVVEWSPNGRGPEGGARQAELSRRGQEGAASTPREAGGAYTSRQDAAASAPRQDDAASAPRQDGAASAPRQDGADGSTPRDGAAAPREARRPRHTKPRRAEVPPGRKVIVGAGRAHGLEPRDVVGAIVDSTHLEGEDIRNVRVLERFSLAEVPAARAREVIEKAEGHRVRGIELRLQAVRD